jgi:2-methylisocitrate lyase-like PEP mutase family enzyme
MATNYGLQLRDVLQRDGIAVAPGVHDPLSALAAERVGFDVVAMTGNGTSLAKLGRPDVGLISITEMVENAKRIQDAVDVPVIADADNGFGNAVNVKRTVEEFVTAGVAGIHIEDQVFPKRCGFVKGKDIVSADEAIGKIEAAVAIREELDPEFVLIARTDARGAPDGSIETAIDRVRAYCEAGADVAFVQGPKTSDDLAAVADDIDAPLLYNVSGGSPVVPLDEAADLGYNLAMFPRMSTLPTIRALSDAYCQLRDDGMAAWTDVQAAFDDVPVDDYDDFAGMPEILEFEQRYVPDADES